MPYSSISELPPRVKDSIPSDDGKRLFLEVFNSTQAEGRSEQVSFSSAWAALQNAGYERTDSGNWVKKAMPSASSVHVPTTERDKAETYKAPESARNNAKRVLRWREEHGDEVKGMTRVGWTRANQLANNENLSLDTVKRMSQFARHRQNAEVAAEYKDTPWKDAGHVAWLGWGGDAGVEWAQRTVDRVEKRYINDDVYTLRDEAAARSHDLGLGGSVHVHPLSDGQAAYMPGASHEDYMQRMGANVEAESHDDGLIDRVVRAIVRAFIPGREPVTKEDPATIVGTVLKIEEEQQMVWGWASVISEDGEPVVDTQGDIISPEELTKAATAFMRDVRVAKAMHEGDQVGEVIHSLPLTKDIAEALGVETAREGWVVAMKINDDAVWKRVKSGELGAFSIGGTAIRELANA